MTRILLSSLKWLGRIGIVTTDIYGVPEKNPRSKQRFTAKLRLIWFTLATAIILLPQVVLIKFYFFLHENIFHQTAYMFLRAADILEIHSKK